MIRGRRSLEEFSSVLWVLHECQYDFTGRLNFSDPLHVRYLDHIRQGAFGAPVSPPSSRPPNAVRLILLLQLFYQRTGKPPSPQHRSVFLGTYQDSCAEQLSVSHHQPTL